MTTNHEELRKLANEASKGPWHWDSDEVKGDPTGRVRFQVTCSGQTITKIYYSSFEGRITNAEDNAKFIAAANPQTILALLDEIVVMKDKVEGSLMLSASLVGDLAGLRNAAECACNALADSIQNGNDAQTNMMWVSKLRKFLRDGE